ncbi:Nucleoside triphosphate pyrophosphohydrolase [Caulifigura coniformis]|uniref:Nucleoside triphosphate pyrophosphohydrolase n=1 Tax=Caulifigura coniformis TaxID=2527983 RepID=A0A517SJX3_9PLAN|nr:nucleoside triphosphate pyrophosphohydrolase [Caulifigura coniformis]QDT56420.1 Nucleoside triphosphate pyrophosphohydrolase [Caulifigura coniformis]
MPAAPLPAPGTPPDPTRLAASFGRFCDVIARLRSPTGCPWDREQTLETIKPFTLEETYELLEAIDSGDDRAISEELGDVLLQVVLDSQIAADEGRFDIIEVIDGVTQKMIDRHPHVFGDAEAATPADVKRQWEKIKAAKQPRESVLDGIPVALPTLARALRITKKAARVGYDFPNRDMLFDKLREEIDELLVELYPEGHRPNVAASVEGPVVPDTPITDASRKARVESEIGDILFVIANIARRWGIDPEEALRSSNEKFSSRFCAIERGLKAVGKTFEQATLQEMEVLYQAEKARMKNQASR